MKRIRKQIKAIIFLLPLIFAGAISIKVINSVGLAEGLFTFFILISLRIGYEAVRSPIPRRVGIRNVQRRLGNTFLVIMGSMVGAALISGSLVLNDSLDKTFENLTFAQIGEGDVFISPVEKSLIDENLTYFNTEEVEQINTLIDDSSISDGTLNLMRLTVTPAILDEKGKPELNAYFSSLVGIDYENAISVGETKVEIPKLTKKNGAILSETMKKELQAEIGDTILINTGDIKIGLVVESFVEDKSFLGGLTITVDKGYLNSILGIEKGSANEIYVSSIGGVIPKDYDGEAFLNEVNESLKDFDSERVDFNSVEIKEQFLNGGGFSDVSLIFLALSSFGIFSGILLIVNLFSMFAEERKKEMGILRVVAFNKKDLTKAFLFEGYIYSVIASVVGTTIGLGLGFILIYLFTVIFGNLFSAIGISENLFDISYSVELSSLVIAFSVGALITIFTAYFASLRISNLNIIEAIKDIKVKKNNRLNLKWWLKTLFYFGYSLIGTISIVLGLLIEGIADSSRDETGSFFNELSVEDFKQIVLVMKAYLLYFGVVYLSIFLSLLLIRAFNDIFKKGLLKLFGTISSIVVIGFTIIEFGSEDFSFALDSDYGVGLFFSTGLVLVLALSILVTLNVDFIIWLLSLIFNRSAKGVLIMKVALRYPAVNRSRTGLTLVMFALVIFLISYISIFKSSIVNTTSNNTEEAFNGYDLTINPGINSTLSSRNEIYNVINNNENVEKVSSITYLNVVLPEYKYKDLPESAKEFSDNGGGMPITLSDDDSYNTALNIVSPEVIAGIDSPLKFRSDKYSTDEEAYAAVANDPDKVVLGFLYANPDLIGTLKLEGGDTLIISDVFEEHIFEKEVVGIVGAGFFGSAGFSQFLPFIISTDTELLSQLPESYLVKNSSNTVLTGFKADIDPDVAFLNLRKELIDYNILQIINLNELTDTISTFIDSMFSMLQGFLAFSLIVGTSGLAIILTRSVWERRQQVGMLRSLGF
ncbi:MAG: FtsX-like permease family protein, partial [Candidatus Dojkabacteria bacterium]|nr:FtsX-like permease family protein [Candidatus Dojkabacteria bacterium]